MRLSQTIHLKMNLKDLKKYIIENKTTIDKIVSSLNKKNTDYNKETIYNMVLTTISLSKSQNPCKKEIYLQTLERILNEKGLSYINGNLSSPFVNLTPQDIENYFSEEDKNNCSSIVNEIILESGLTQTEVFVTALNFSLPSPVNLTGKYKEILDNMEEIYYMRSLTQKEISMITNISIFELNKIKKQAFKKMEKYCESNGIHWATKD